MACAACAKKKPNSYQDFNAIQSPPFRATDIFVYSINSNESRPFNQDVDWDTSKINVLLLFPDISVVKEIGDANIEGVNISYVTNQNTTQIQGFLASTTDELQRDVILCSYLLPSRLNLLYNGQTRNAIVYVLPDGNIAVQQQFYGSTFNYSSIKSFIDDYNANN